jgi:peptidoglycan/LPS O-acetylase OafA/YrhL
MPSTEGRAIRKKQLSRCHADVLKNNSSPIAMGYLSQITQDVTVETAPRTANRFYRPELDALRFFAFLAVLLHHGPSPSGLLHIISDVGGFGLSMFFFLSAYLISELLFREREKTGMIAWDLFFIRRALRIWPLYYAALAAGIVFASIPPHHFWISRTGTAAMSVFVANWIRTAAELGPLLAPLWSISVEEQFYFIWPPIVKIGGKRLAFAVSLFLVLSSGVWLWAFSQKGWRLWYDTPVEFLFFAAGVLTALATHGKPLWTMNGVIRGGLLVAGLFLFAVAAQIGGIGTDEVQGLTSTRLYTGYGAAVIGCAAVFLAVLGISNVPRALIHLGKISYGLYVFHAGILSLSNWLVKPLKLVPTSALKMVIVDGFALLLCIFAAHISYKYLEMPFLRLKERFEVIHSRPA